MPDSIDATVPSGALARIRFGGDVGTMNRLGVIGYLVVIATVGLLTSHQAVGLGVYVCERHGRYMMALGVAGLFLASLGPVALSLWFWRLARRVKPQWVWHLLFLPCAIAIYRVGASILFYAADVPDGDSIEGYYLVPSGIFLVLNLFVHAAALIAQCVGLVRRRANVR